MGYPASKDGAWRQLPIGIHTLEDLGGRVLGRVWGVRATAPWFADAGGHPLGSFETVDDARAAVEAVSLTPDE